jgi:hypothetical protein
LPTFAPKHWVKIFKVIWPVNWWLEFVVWAWEEGWSQACLLADDSVEEEVRMGSSVLPSNMPRHQPWPHIDRLV